MTDPNLPQTPRERILIYLDMCNAMEGDYTPDVNFQRDIRTVCAANAGYERIIAEQRREAVAEYKKTLAAELRSRAQAMPADEVYYTNKAADALEATADDLEDGTL